ncbi:uncharacterized protein EAE97_009079 [Botrytis byssoidea]|uniref:Uncharacterized protein n=1 Tax=Botrytis byssoidea TaxID=139641 RepID=A0A9P5LNH4_9HELO|nr:uncharacterized protein EAE97_009079 [Botrytis byssoidea]KAF7932058.1 hypothetical protein EAE97_009079 [Botrytis byssoidea]
MQEDERSEVIERSESKLLPSIPSIYSAPYPPYLSAFSSRFHTPPPPLPGFPPHFPLSPTSYYPSSPKVPNTWKIIRICGVEDIKSTEWADGIETEAIDDKKAIEHPENLWSERRQNFAPGDGEWIPMAWIPKPIGDIDVSTIPDTGPHNIFHSFTHSHFSQYSSSYLFSSYSNLNPQNQKLHISQSWKGTTGENSNGFGYRGRVLGQSRLPGMMSELGAYLQNERVDNGNWGSRTDTRERMRERGMRWERGAGREIQT